MRATQRGNAMIYILIGIFLFAALAYTFIKAGKSGQGNLTARQADIAASEMVGYADAVAKAVDRLRQKGCSENEISFETTPTDGYQNANSPTDKRCHVFDSNGGNITGSALNTSWFDPAYSANIYYGMTFFSGRTRLEVVGDTNNAELVMFIPYIKREICEKIDKILGVGSIFPDADNVFSTIKFNGNYGQTTRINSGPTTSQVYLAACSKSSTTSTNPSPNTYFFYQTLIVR